MRIRIKEVDESQLIIVASSPLQSSWKFNCDPKWVFVRVKHLSPSFDRFGERIFVARGIFVGDALVMMEIIY